jgi:hypothetical protein
MARMARMEKFRAIQMQVALLVRKDRKVYLDHRERKVIQVCQVRSVPLDYRALQVLQV